MGSTRGFTLRNRRTVLFAIIMATASAVAAILLTRAKEPRPGSSLQIDHHANRTGIDHRRRIFSPHPLTRTGENMATHNPERFEVNQGDSV
jgi:hypothetical protein